MFHPQKGYGHPFWSVNDFIDQNLDKGMQSPLAL